MAAPLDLTPRSRAERRLLSGPPPTARGPRSWLYAAVTVNPPPGDPDLITRWVVITRAAVLPMTLVAGAVGGLLAVGQRGLRPGYWALAVLGITLAHLNNNLTNDLFDTSVGTDAAGYPRTLYAPHPLLSGLTTRRALLSAVAATLVGDAVIGVILLAVRGPGIAVLAVAGLVLSVAYTAPPLRLKKRGLGEPDVAVVWGPLMVGGCYLAATGHLPWRVWVASVPYGLLCTTVLMGKHIDKIRYDAPAGTRTLPVILGEQRARAATRGLLAAFYLTVLGAVALRALPWPTLVVVAGLPRLARVWTAFGHPAPTEPPPGFPVWPLWFAAVAFVHTRRAGALLVLGLAVAAVTGWR